MTGNTITTVLLFFVSITFLSCNSQVKSEQKENDTKTREIGKTVSELDDQIWKIFD